MAMTIKPGHVERIVSPQYMIDQLIDALERNNFLIEKWDVEVNAHGIDAHVIAKIPSIILGESLQKAVDDLSDYGIGSSVSYQATNSGMEVKLNMHLFTRQRREERYEHQTAYGESINISRRALINDDMGVFANSWNGFFTPIPPASLEILRKTQHPDWYDEKEERDDGVI